MNHKHFDQCSPLDCPDFQADPDEKLPHYEELTSNSSAVR